MNLLHTSLKLKVLLLVLLLYTTQNRLQAQLIISTLAGTGTPGYSGDGGPSTAANINVPYGVAVDPIGNVFIADYANNRIRKIDTFGTMSTVAGTGFSGFTGDGGPATSAQIYAPRGITTDAAGNVFFSDYANNRIRKISTAGIITTVAGNGLPGFSGDGGPATAAKLNYAWGVTLDAAGNLYIADQTNCRIRKVTPGGIISTVGGTGIAFFSGDGGPATSAGIQYPMGIVSDGPGNLYICDEGDCRIRKINTSGIISTIAGTGFGGFTGDGGPATLAKLYYPQGIARDNTGNIYIADLNNNRIRMVNTSGIINTITGNGTAGFTGDGGPPALAEINQSTGVAVGLSGKIYIADNNNNRIRIIHALSHSPYFTNGHHINLTFCPVESVNLDSLLMVFDIDTGQTETWTNIVPPLHGTVTGGAYSTLSTGSYLIPSGYNYIQAPGYSGLDSFKMRITDGTYSDTTTFIMNLLTYPNAGTISGTDSLCPGDTLTFTDTASGGSWSSGNPAVATISGSGRVIAVSGGSTSIIYTVTNACGTVHAYFPLLISTHCHTAVNTASLYVNDEIIIYPNPSSGNFTLNQQANHPEEIKYIITNVLGEKVKEIIGYSNTPISVQMDKPAGIYFISSIASTGILASKVMLVK